MTGTEIRRGDFVYRDTLFADPGGDKRHPRASIAELRDLLLPHRQQACIEDQVGHWYEAQLIHYGLPRTKDKNAAKLRLISALASESLTVPTSIARMEAEMKRDFVAAKRRSKTVATRDLSCDGYDGRKEGAARATVDRREAYSSTNIIFNFVAGDTRIDINHPGGGAHPKRQKIEPCSQAAERSRSRPARTTPAANRPNHTRRINNAAARSASRQTQAAPGSSYQDTQLASSQPSGSVRSRNEHSNNDNGIRDEIDDLPPPYSSLGYDQAPSTAEKYSYPRPPRLQVSGAYDIIVGYDQEPWTLVLIKDTQMNQFWGHFDSDELHGVIHIPDISGITSQRRLMFNWRAHDEATSQFRFRRDQCGWIQFDGQGGVHGCWEGLWGDGDVVEFDGTRNSDGHVDVCVEELMDRWDWFVKCAYGR